MYKSHISAQPKPPWAKKIGGSCEDEKGLSGMAERSSRGPEGVSIEERIMPAGKGEPFGGLGEGARH